MATSRMTESREPRSLADWLRSADDATLATLFAERPDLIVPVPPDVTVLAARAAARPSVLAAIDRLNVFQLEVLELLTALSDPIAQVDIGAAVGDVPEAALHSAVARLREIALVWGNDDDLHVLRTVRDLVDEPCGLGPPLADAVTGLSTNRLRDLLSTLHLEPAPDRHTAIERLRAWAADRGAVCACIAEASDEVRDLLARLSWGPPTGMTETPARTPAVRWAMQHALLVATGDRTVVLPREIAIALRTGVIVRHATVAPRSLDVVQLDPKHCAHTAASHAAAFVRMTEDVLDSWASDPPAGLRTGGLRVRDLRRTAVLLDQPEAVAAVVIEVAYAAGLVASTPNDEWLPTPAYDGWRVADDGERWALLANAWVQMSRVPGLATERDGGRGGALLGYDLDRMLAAPTRQATLQSLANLPEGAASNPQSVGELLAWLGPRRGGQFRNEMVGWTFTEAALLGVTGAGAIVAPGRRVLEGDVSAASAAMKALLPDPIDSIVIQGDLTAVAPGRLTRELARELSLLADVESTGHATVYRFSAQSVRRALDAGRSASDVHDLLTKMSTTPVPQPLTYLVDDIARRHGRVRVGTASAYIRCDDDSIVGELLADRRLNGLGLRRLAPTVVSVNASAARALSVLRESGYAPAAESEAGDVVIQRPGERRTARARPPTPLREPGAPAPAVLEAAVRALRAGDHAATTPRRLITEPPSAVMPATSSAGTLFALQQAANDGRPLWIGYVNAQGAASQRVVEPVSVSGGYLRAFDHLRDEVRTFAIHRITGVAELLDDELVHEEAVDG
ncbi:MAG: helicase-associated domain-containing protein [Actinomycetes bacterium]